MSDRPKRYIILKENISKYENLVKILCHEMDSLEEKTVWQEREIEKLLKELKDSETALENFLRAKEEIIEALKKMGLVEEERIIGKANYSPSGRIENKNPRIRIIRYDEWLQEKKRIENAEEK